MNVEVILFYTVLGASLVAMLIEAYYLALSVCQAKRTKTGAIVLFAMVVLATLTFATLVIAGAKIVTRGLERPLFSSGSLDVLSAPYFLGIAAIPVFTVFFFLVVLHKTPESSEPLADPTPRERRRRGRRFGGSSIYDY